MRFQHGKSRSRKGLKWILFGLAFLAVLALMSGFVYYQSLLRPVSGQEIAVEVVVAEGSGLSEIAATLKDKDVIRSEWAFKQYVWLKRAQGDLKAGSYSASPSYSTPQIVSLLTEGRVSRSMITILPGQRLDQIRDSLIRQGFSESDVDKALDPVQYESLAVLAGKPAGASLEGYVFPETFERAADTAAVDVVRRALLEMEGALTAERRAGFERQGLSVYEAITIASIVENEVVDQEERKQAAQVFIKRLREGVSLGSDPTAYYGSRKAGLGDVINYDTPYNTRLHAGLPPTPISNVSASSLDAVASPAQTDWLFFVSGDDGTTYFSKTLAEHEELTRKYCTTLCQ